MPHDIIDLLSSPEPIPVARKASEKSTVATTSTRHSKALGYNSKSAGVDFFILSSDDENYITKVTSKPVHKASSTAPSKPLSGPPSNTAKRFFENNIPRDSGVYFHSDDFDTSVDLDASTNEPKSSSSGLLGLNRKQMEEERFLRIKQKEKADLAGVQGAISSSNTSNTASKPPYIPSPNARFNSLSTTMAQSPHKSVKPNNTEVRKFSKTSWDVLDDEDDPFASSPPPAKKRRLSFSSITSPPKPTIPKASGYKRSISNIEPSTRLGAAKAKTPAVKRSNTTSKSLEIDPILFTSSPDHVAEAKRRKEKRRDIFSEDKDDLFEDKFRAKDKALRDESEISSDESLPDIDALPNKVISKKSSSSSKRPKSAIDKYEADKAAEKKKDEKCKKDAARKAAKEAKEAEKERKCLEKEEKAKEKQLAVELAEVNKLRTDKNLSAKEMIVDLPDSLDPKLASQVHTFFRAQGRSIEFQEYSDPQCIIKWRRKVVAEFDEDLGYRVNVEAHIKDEPHVMYIMSAKEFVDLATGDEGDELDLHVVQMKSKYESCKPIYLIQGLDAWKKKNKTINERQYKDAVRSYQGEPAGSQRPKKYAGEYVDEELVEDALAKLQILDTKVHHTDSMVETAEWILAFTLQISTIPYKLEQSAHDTGFCMENGQIRSGDGAKDTFIKMLEQHLRVTAPVAWGIVAEYPTVQELIKGFRKYGPHALKDCRICANKDGAFTDRNVGKKISERLHAIFTDTDPNSWDV